MTFSAKQKKYYSFYLRKKCKFSTYFYSALWLLKVLPILAIIYVIVYCPAAVEERMVIIIVLAFMIILIGATILMIAAMRYLCRKYSFTSKLQLEQQVSWL